MLSEEWKDGLNLMKAGQRAGKEWRRINDLHSRCRRLGHRNTFRGVATVVKSETPNVPTS